MTSQKSPKHPAQTPFERRQIAKKALRLLKEQYHSPRHNNPSAPLDDLIFIILSAMTTGPSYERVYLRLKEVTESWEAIADMAPAALELIIKDAGLSRQKAPRIIAALRRIRNDFGLLSLDALRGWKDARVQRYLTSLPAVGIKTAKCVMMYTLDRAVLPVDTHVLRVSRRLGILEIQTPAAKIHDALEAVVRPADRFHFHVNAVAHGKAICRAKQPLCGQCFLKRICQFSVTGIK